MLVLSSACKEPEETYMLKEVGGLQLEMGVHCAQCAGTAHEKKDYAWHLHGNKNVQLTL